MFGGTQDFTSAASFLFHRILSDFFLFLKFKIIIVGKSDRELYIVLILSENITSFEEAICIEFMFRTRDIKKEWTTSTRFGKQSFDWKLLDYRW